MGANLIKRLPVGLQRWWIKQISFWPPFLGAGIRVKEISPDFLKIRSILKLRWYNRNYVGTHFGGSIYSMTDPFYMLMLIQNLGPGYIVWDLAAKIRFKLPGRGAIHADFELTPQELEEIKSKATKNDKVIVRKKVQVKDQQDQVIAIVYKILFIRRKI